MKRNFVLFPITKWHLYGMLAYIAETFTDEAFTASQINVFAIKHSNGNYLLESNDVVYDSVTYRREEDIKNGNSFFSKFCSIAFHKKRSANEEVVALFAHALLPKKLLSVFSKEKYKQCRLRCVLVDDGIGSYSSKKVWKRCSEGEKGSRLKQQFKSFASWLITKALKPTDWHMFLKRKQTLVPLHTNGYLKVINDDIKKQFKDELITFKNQYFGKKIVLFLSQPWSETGQLSHEQENKVLESVINVSNNRESVLLIKPHPRESLDKFSDIKAHILDEKLPAEFFLSALDENCLVIGYNSTALLNAAVIFGLRTISVFKLVNFENKDSMMYFGCKEFYELTNSFIDFPSFFL